MMAAIRAGQLQQDVTLIEKNQYPGRKLLLSGKGRCNLTNACGLEEFLERFSRRGDFLRDAFKKFFNQELMHFFEEGGVPLKTERQLRVFPASDSSASIVKALKAQLAASRVTELYRAEAKEISVLDGRAAGVQLADGRQIPADKVILATGGISYRFTGSTGDGFAISRRLGHHVTPLLPGLVPLETREKFPRLLEGLALKNIRLVLDDKKRRVASEIGELLFTETGISGPLVLSLSGKISEWLLDGRRVCVEIDLKPALSADQLDERILREFKAAPRKTLGTVMHTLLPKRMIDVFLEQAALDPAKKVSYITGGERAALVKLLKGFRLEITQPRPIEEAMVTRGGVTLKEIDPRTMESRLVKGLYFAGEIIDIDADTGGFNLQAAFSTGYLAGESAARD